TTPTTPTNDTSRYLTTPSIYSTLLYTTLTTHSQQSDISTDDMSDHIVMSDLTGAITSSTNSSPQPRRRCACKYCKCPNYAQEPIYHDYGSPLTPTSPTTPSTPRTPGTPSSSPPITPCTPENTTISINSRRSLTTPPSDIKMKHHDHKCNIVRDDCLDHHHNRRTPATIATQSTNTAVLVSPGSDLCLTCEHVHLWGKMEKTYTGCMCTCRCKLQRASHPPTCPSSPFHFPTPPCNATAVTSPSSASPPSLFAMDLTTRLNEDGERVPTLTKREAAQLLLCEDCLEQNRLNPRRHRVHGFFKGAES
ncbi:uncharacterized protein GGS25DRAFT_527865, partial [Hypoxylon fragiforme]|uniref:uncharacterized protein n=1 Tax=Hypoxylon fragiforme TaxID=63214 RepID=UPI0020C6F6A3